eukprot:scaffold272680_cov23-Tisochrysis_lutea.AAC.1
MQVEQVVLKKEVVGAQPAWDPSSIRAFVGCAQWETDNDTDASSIGHALWYSWHWYVGVSCAVKFISMARGPR